MCYPQPRPVVECIEEPQFALIEDDDEETILIEESDISNVTEIESTPQHQPRTFGELYQSIVYDSLSSDIENYYSDDLLEDCNLF